MRTGYLHIFALLSLNRLVSSTPTPHHDAPLQDPSALDAPIPGYKVFVPEWEAQAHPHGEKTRINGTAEEVLLKLRSINPAYDRHFGLDQPGDEVDEGGVRRRQGSNVQFARVVCNNFPLADATYVAQGVSYLRRVRGQPENSPGPETCGRVSCSYNTAIWWCNDVKPYSVTLSSFHDIADGVFAISQACRDTKREYSGQAIHAENWSVGVRSEPC